MSTPTIELTQEQQALVDTSLRLLHIQRTMYEWINQSRSGGWSTHQVEPQRRLAADIGELLAKHHPVLVELGVMPAGPQ